MVRAPDVRRLLEYIGDPTFRYVEFDFSDVAPLPSEALADSFLRSGERGVSAVLEAERPDDPGNGRAEPVARRLRLRRVGPSSPEAVEGVAVVAAERSNVTPIGERVAAQPAAALPPWMASTAGPEVAEAEPDHAQRDPEAPPDDASQIAAGPDKGRDVGTPLADVFGRLER